MAPKPAHTIMSKIARLGVKWSTDTIFSRITLFSTSLGFNCAIVYIKKNHSRSLTSTHLQKYALPASFYSLSKAQNILSDADTQPPTNVGKFIYGCGLHSQGHRSVPNDSCVLGQQPNILLI